MKDRILSIINNMMNKHEDLVVFDIGSTSIKMLEANSTDGAKDLFNIASVPIDPQSFSKNIIVNQEAVAQRIEQLTEAQDVEEKRVVTSLPASSVFTKRIKIEIQSSAALAESIQYEAGSFIPYNIDEVKVDYHVLGRVGSKLEIMVVVVKNEIVDNLIETFAMAGLEIAVMDIDFFAMQNCFEMSYPEMLNKPVAIVDTGARFSSVNLCKNGKSFFVGDIAVGGNVFTEAISGALGIPISEAEQLKLKPEEANDQQAELREVLTTKIDEVAVEFNRQLSLFWNASGLSDGIKKIYFTGGNSLLSGFVEAIAEKTGVESLRMDPLKLFDLGDRFNLEQLQDLNPYMCICAGMYMRQPGDKDTFKANDFEETELQR